MLPIGQFSRATGLTIKAIRFYEERGLLTPARVDADTNYRYYGDAEVQRARLIHALRGLSFGLDEIRALVDEGVDPPRLVAALARKKAELQGEADRLGVAIQTIERVLDGAGAVTPIERDVPPLLIAGLRRRARYADAGIAFGQLGAAVGRWAAGPALTLYWEAEYAENEADLEFCLPVRERVTVPGITVRELPAARVLSLVHEGPYDTLGPSYGALLASLASNGAALVLPIREHYLVGPGPRGTGDPQRYRTELQVALG